MALLRPSDAEGTRAHQAADGSVSKGETNRFLLSAHLTDPTAKQLLALTASAGNVSSLTSLITEAAAQRLAEIEEECAGA